MKILKYENISFEFLKIEKKYSKLLKIKTFLFESLKIWKKNYLKFLKIKIILFKAFKKLDQYFFLKFHQKSF